MRTLLVVFEYRGSYGDKTPQACAVKLLNANSVYADRTTVLTPNDKASFLKLMGEKDYDAAFVVNSAICDFSVNDALKEIDIFPDSDGIFMGDAFVSLLSLELDEKHIAPSMKKLQEFFNCILSKVSFKLFGVELSDIVKATDEICERYDDVFFQTDINSLDARTVMFYDGNTSKAAVDGAIKAFLMKFKDYIYAEDDVTLEKRLNDLLKLRRRIIATAESITGGLIASKIVSVSGASNVFYEGFVTYDTSAKEERLGVQHSTVVNYGVVSSQVAYQMAKGLLDKGKASCAISITGYAEPNNETTIPLCFIGIGVDERVEVYRYPLSGNRAEAILTAANAALFLMIKEITNV